MTACDSAVMAELQALYNENALSLIGTQKGAHSVRTETRRCCLGSVLCDLTTLVNPKVDKEPPS